MVGEAAWALPKFVLKTFDKLSGNKEKADEMWGFLMKSDNARQALHAYHNAFDAVKDGDTSSDTCSRFVACFLFAQQSCKRMIEAEPVNWNKTQEQKDAWSKAYTQVVLTKIDGVTEYP